ncbi:cyclic nucleotide-binding domain-containing protein [Marinomonas ostreistagni]|uniref:cyclic nucleotide-binding domain-containing protein n=1 Tax=Marinomonas ostreistagni TaxID=359209 RepID=UPI0019501C6E|nr:Crp/Fnr family transcriptional regulator [Marinomonas ostreistagni]MBM6550236.1 Crp/Fnr family transcriptional regulator [Marinomonas ostreistagni]
MNTVDVRNCPYDLSIESLKTGSIFGALSASAIEYLTQAGTLKQYQQGELVYQDGDKGDSFYIIIEGTFDYFLDSNSSTSLIRRLVFGEALGYVTMVALSPRQGYTVAATDGMLLEINPQVFAEFHDRFAFDFGILILNLSRDMARNIQVLARTLSDAGVSIDLSKS